MKRRVSYQTKMLNLLIELPLAVFVVDFVWGWLKIDAGDTPGRASYGWLYVIFGFSRVLFNFITLDSPFTQLVPMLLLINLISVVFYNRCSKEEPVNDSKINQ